MHSLPFDSGHVLALRVLPQNDFAPYVTVWHRTPAGDWSIFVDAPRVDDPALDLRVTMGASRPLRMLNAAHAAMPFVVRRSRVYARMMELMARWLLDMGPITMRGTMPSGHVGVVMPAQILYITQASAVLDGTDLGVPDRVPTGPRIGEFGLPARPTFAVGGGFFKIRDPEEYRRTVGELRAGSLER